LTILAALFMMSLLGKLSLLRVLVVKV